MIYNEDCLEGMKRLADGSVDLIATDPPYCVGATSNGTKASYSDFNLMRPFWDLCLKEWLRILKPAARIDNLRACTPHKNPLNCRSG